MTILLADALSATCVAALEQAGHTVLSKPQLKGDTLTESLAADRPNVLVVRSTKVPAAAIEAAPTLELIVRAGAGTDNIDMDSASGRGVFVANCPGKNAVAVAELTMGLILALDRSIPDNVIDARNGVWNKAKYGKAAGLKGRTIGLIGLGSIGTAVARRAASFGMTVIAWSRSLTDARADELGISRRESPIDVARDADIVSLHVAANADTKGMADRAFFESMREGAFFINTTRSSVVNEDALTWAMQEKGIRAGVDVFSEEPAVKSGPFESSLAALPSVYITHHVGASTAQAQEAIALEAARVVNVYAESGDVPNCVNLAKQTPATHQITVRHLDQVGVLAAVLDELRTAGWNVQEMENVVFSGARAACAYIRFDGDPDSQVLARISNHPDVLAVSVIAL